MATLEGIYNFLRLSDSVATAGQPTEEELTLVKSAGYEVVVNLLPMTSPNALPDEGRLVAALGMDYVPIPVDWQNPVVSDAEHFFRVMEEYQGRRIFVHCAANMRVSVFLYLYRTICHAEDPAEAAKPLHAIWDPNETWRHFMSSFDARKGEQLGR